MDPDHPHSFHDWENQQRNLLAKAADAEVPVKPTIAIPPVETKNHNSK